MCWKSTGGEHVRMCGFRPAAAEAFRCGMQCLAISSGARVVICHIRSRRLTSICSVGTGKIAEAQFTRMSMPPKASTVRFTAVAIESSSRTSTVQASARPPRASTSSAAAKIVPGRVLCASVVLAQMATFAPSRAARLAMASPMPREAPVITRVLPLRLPPPPSVAWGPQMESAAMRWVFPPPSEAAQTCAPSTPRRRSGRGGCGCCAAPALVAGVLPSGASPTGTTCTALHCRCVSGKDLPSSSLESNARGVMSSTCARTGERR
mmetsp:Transcript_99540/g.320907  ORF Transcript_99540/g.320907 Transcript_99540/m.320907 type:complete len:265 (-) Transcript_99540:1708-2502(-)